MTQLNTANLAGPRAKAASDVYTVLTFLALVALICGIAFVWYRATTLFGTQNPFELLNQSTALSAPASADQA